MTNPGRRALQIFEALVATSDAERAARLDRHCAGDPALRAEVERLLQFDLPELAEDLPLETPVLASGDRLASFEIRGLLGQGAHGVVYRAWQQRPPREVALKVIGGADSSSVQRRFAAEIAAQARLNHPGIVQVYEVGVAEASRGALAFLAMELVDDGRPLLAHLRERQPGLRDRIDLIARLADALEHAHQRGVLHGDLKPENILVVAGEGAPQPKVLDFGVARARDAGGEPSGFAGTPAYCAPERVLAEGDAWDVRSDVYALGVVAFEVLTGQLPIDVRGDDAPSGLARVAVEEPRLASSFDRRLRGDVDCILSRAIARRPQQRYASAREFAADLRRYLGYQPVLARAGGVAYRVGRFLRRRPARAAGLLALGALLAILAGAWIHRQAQTRWALGVVKTVLATAIESMDRLPGTAPARTECLEQLLGQLAPVVRALPGDPQVLAVYADLLRRRGHVERDLGHWDAALTWRRRGLAARERLAALDARPEVESELALDLVLVGDVYLDTRRFAEARAWYERAHAHFETLASAHPENRRFVDDLGCSCDRLVAVLDVVAAEDLDAIERLLEQRERINADLQRLAPDHRATLLGLNTHQGQRAALAQRRGEVERALEFLRARMATGRQLVARFGGEKLSMLRLVEAASRLAEAAAAHDRVAEARAALEEARPVAETLRAGGEEPGQVEALYFFLTDARVALAEHRPEVCQRLVRGVVEDLAARPSPRTAWLGEVARTLAAQAARAPR